MEKIRYQIDPGSNTVKKYRTVTVYQTTQAYLYQTDLEIENDLEQWFRADPGQFVIAYSTTKPVIHYQRVVERFGEQARVVAELEEKKLAEFYLKWGNKQKD